MNLKVYRKVERGLDALPSIEEYMTRKRHPSFYLERTRVLLKKLQHPEKQFKYIHIGGTAGKGSVTMMLHYILHYAKKRVGSYISPHVTTLAERTTINTRIASINDIVWAWNKVSIAIKQIKKEFGNEYIPSYFEANFAMSLLIFKKKKVAWVTLEVGCGGEFDATNVIPTPHVTVLTNIFLDHTQLLGKTRNKIARTKTGIIKQGTHVITGEEDKQIRKILKKVATRKQATFAYVPTTARKNFNTLLLAGDHQIHNALLAQKTAEFLRIPNSSITKGLEKTKLPARFEAIETNPLIILDGAHNPAKMVALKKLVTNMQYNRLILIFGISHNKDHKQILKTILPLTNNIIFTHSSQKNPKSLPGQRLYAIAKKLFSHKQMCSSSSIKNAIKKAKQLSTTNDLILITGSLYLAGEARKLWISEKYILTHHNLFIS